ncbi:MAG: HAD family hydrolase [Myxococcales bacterium]
MVARFTFRESLRHDAHRELAALRDGGLELWLVSGDGEAKVQSLAAELGIPRERALAEQTPEQKAAIVTRLDAGDTLYLGDGVNDSLAFDAALCAGTPAIDRPVMPGKADFFLVGESLTALSEALGLASALRRTVRRVLVIALTYNALAITECLLGWMTPLRAAIAMPASSLSVLLFVLHSLGPRRGVSRAPLARSVQTPPREVPA